MTDLDPNSYKAGDGLAEKAQERPSEKKTAPRKNWKRPHLWILLGIAAAVIAVVILTVGLSGQMEQEQAVRVRDAEDAIEYLKSQGEALGYENALSELTELHTATVGGDSYYRMQQNYRGIPVYGRTVTCAADKHDRLLTVAQNVRDIPQDLVLEPSVTVEQAERHILACLKAEYPEGSWKTCPEFVLDQEKLCIYDLEGTACLAYEVTVGDVDMVIHGQDGQVLHTQRRIYREAASFAGGGQIDVPRTENGLYVLTDEETGVYMYNAEGKTYWNIGKGEIYPNVPVLIDSENNVFGDDDDSVRGERALRAEAILDQVNDIGSYFETVTGRKVLDRIFVIYDDALDDGQGMNAGGGYDYARSWIDDADIPGLEPGENPKVGCLVLGKFYSKDVAEYSNIYAHEYTHLISKKYVNWAGNGKNSKDENGAINEAFSDIFGELYEAYTIGGEPDWVHNDPNSTYTRSLRDPGMNGHPAKLGDKLPSGIRYSHAASTVISHIAYKLARGDLQNPATKLSLAELEELLYRTMLLLNADADFEDLRTWITEAAWHIGLSSSQRRWIDQVFDEAGIRYEMAKGCRIDVCGADMKPYEDYEVTVSQTVIDDRWFGKDRTVETQFEVDRFAASFRLDLPEGVYCITIRNQKNPSQVVTYDVKIVASADKDLPESETIYTDFAAEQTVDEPVANTGAVEYSLVLWDRSRLDESGKSTENYYFEYVQVKGNTPAIQKINDTLYAMAEDVMNRYEDGEAVADLGDGRMDGYCKVFSRVTYNTGGILGITITKDQYEGGNTSHGSFFHYYFSVNTGEEATLAELMGKDEETFLPELRQIALEKLQERFGDILFGSAEYMINQMELEDFDFDVKEGQIWLHFDQYSVVDGTFGEVSIETGLYLPGE